ncbi:MAG: hypothetical protein WCW03_00100 [Candidatus Paceibacterota bacterium]|jgi:ribulose-phosphate 3-epimerase
MNEIEIIPAILPKDFDEIIEKVSLVKNLAKIMQIDICDGRFVPSMTWPYENDSGEFEKIVNEDEGMPEWEIIDYEFDLMVNNTEEIVDKWVLAGANRIVLHAEAKGDIKKAIEILKDRVEIGLALNIETPISEIGKYEGINFIQLMGIYKVGFQGQEFDTRVIEKVKEVKKTYSNYPVSVDGGVSFDNALQLIESGANRLIVGSNIFESNDVSSTINKFLAINNH